jgi:hypothetical protein
MIFQLCIDESGYGQTGPDDAFVFAGYLASLKTWEIFTHRWGSVAPGLSLQKLKKLFHSKPDNRSADGNDLLKQYVSVIGRLRLFRLSICIPAVAYQKAFKQQLSSRDFDRDILYLHDNQYFMAFYGLMISALTAMKDWPPDACLRIVYDRNIREAAKLKDGYRDYLDNASHDQLTRLVGEPIPEDDEGFVPLQAADLIALHIFRDYRARRRGTRHDDWVWAYLRDLPVLQDHLFEETDLRGLFSFVSNSARQY